MCKVYNIVWVISPPLIKDPTFIVFLFFSLVDFIKYLFVVYLIHHLSFFKTIIKNDKTINKMIKRVKEKKIYYKHLWGLMFVIAAIIIRM